MHFVPGYSMMAATATTFMLSMIFLLLSGQSKKQYMRFWGLSWLVYSAMFLLDFCHLNWNFVYLGYVMLRQMLALLGSYTFLLGTHHFFQIKCPAALGFAAILSTISMVLYPASYPVYTLMIIPNIIFSSGLLIYSGCMFIAISWTQKLPEKLIASFLIILWSIFINHFAFSLKNQQLEIGSYYISIFTVNVLILTLIIIYFKKLRFIDTKQHNRFRLLVENSSDSMFLYDYKRQQFEYISPGISSLIGISEEKLYEMPERFFDYVNTPKRYSSVLSIFSRPVKRPNGGILMLYKNGIVERWSQIHYIPIRDNTGTVSAVEGILRDITEQKRAEESLKEAEEAKKEFLENISHEIKTPITLIQGYTESLLDKVVPPESTDTYLKMINSKANVLTTLLSDLAQISDMSSQTMEYKFYEHNASDIMQELIQQGEFHITTSGHTVSSKVNIVPYAVIIIDPQRIQQVISNLISNAIRHTPSGRKISISCVSYPHEDMMHAPASDDDYSIPDGEILVTVSDQGDGIPEKDIPHIFERNFSGVRRIQTSPSGKGNSGLGLYISSQIISQHSGRMSAKNNPDGGASLSFSLPYYR